MTISIRDATASLPFTSRERVPLGRPAIASALFLSLAALSPFLSFLGLHGSVVGAIFLGCLGLTGDAYLEMKHAAAGKQDDPQGALKLFLHILKGAPASARLNYLTDLAILVLVLFSLKYGNVPPGQRFLLVLILFLAAMMSIMLIWWLRTYRKK